MDLLQFTKKGIYCPQAKVYIDPWKAVDKALITHGHADHARWGSRHYLCHHHSKPILHYRLRTDAPIQSVEYGEKVVINGVDFSFHPAGHILGSSQIRVSYQGEVWVASGDYKLSADGLSTPFEPVRCHTFITESTFGLPIYKWKSSNEVFREINKWWRQNQVKGKTTILLGYSLGKAQNILQNVDATIGPIFTHGAIENINEIFRSNGIQLPATTKVTSEVDKMLFPKSLVVAPPSAAGSSWLRKFLPYEIGIASGWMGLRGARRRRSVDRGFVLSDHADWDGLNQAVAATGAERVVVTHGYTNIFTRWLTEQGYSANAVETLYEGELGEINESSTAIDQEEAV